MVRGVVDGVNTKSVSGWAYSPNPGERLSVEAVINDQVIGKAVANRPRPDLAAAGFGDGNCGFEIPFANELESAYLPFVQVMLASTDLELRRWGIGGFGEYFRALYQRHPHAGRFASVYGGLWTDRVDAAALLKGRADIGIVAPDQANFLSRFIQDGAIVVRGSKAGVRGNGQRSTANDLTSVVAAALFDESVLGAMRAILDDHPVAVRADVLGDDEQGFAQMSALEDLPSPAECLGFVFPADEHGTVAVDVVRGSHRFPEFLPDGLSRWTHVAGARVAQTMLDGEMPVDRYSAALGNGILVGPGSLFRIRVGSARGVRLLILPARLSLVRFVQRAPAGELTHESGARIWI